MYFRLQYACCTQTSLQPVLKFIRTIISLPNFIISILTPTDLRDSRGSGKWNGSWVRAFVCWVRRAVPVSFSSVLFFLCERPLGQCFLAGLAQHAYGMEWRLSVCLDGNLQAWLAPFQNNRSAKLCKRSISIHWAENPGQKRVEFRRILPVRCKSWWCCCLLTKLNGMEFIESIAIFRIRWNTELGCETSL